MTNCEPVFITLENSLQRKEGRRGEERRGEGEETKGTNRRRGIKEGGRR